MSDLVSAMMTSISRSALGLHKWGSESSRKHTAESGIGQVLFVLGKLARTSNAANIHGNIVPQLVRKRLLGKDVRHGDPAAWLEQAMHLLEDKSLVGIGDEVDDAVGDDAVGCLRLERDVGDDALDERDVVCVLLGGFDLVGAGKHVLEEGGLDSLGRGEGRHLLTSFMSMPMAFPLAPTLEEARKTSKPAPLPRSTTVSPLVNG